MSRRETDNWIPKIFTERAGPESSYVLSPIFCSTLWSFSLT